MLRFTIASCLVFAAFTAYASVIDFETLPDGTPTWEGMPIHDQYNVAPYWVRFELVGEDPGTGPKIAAVGPPMTAYFGPPVYSACGDESSVDDKPAVGEPVGCFFLTDDGISNPDDSHVLRVAYTIPVRQVSGSLLDVDNLEQWTITALEADAITVVDQQVISAGGPGTGDGVASIWYFDSAQDIYFIDFELVGSGSAGLGFDNFSPASIPTDLVVTKAGPSEPVQLESELHYAITVSNRGPGYAADVIMEDTLPPGVVFTSAIPSQGTCTEESGLVTCELGGIAMGDSATVQISGLLSAVGIVNSAVAYSSTGELDGSDNAAAVVTAVECFPSGISGDEGGALSPRLGRASPNPSGGSASLSFTLPSPGLARILVYDVAGRVVRHLFDESLPPGDHSLKWDGLNDAGQLVASGTYFLELRVDDTPSPRRKMVVVR